MLNYLRKRKLIESSKQLLPKVDNRFIGVFRDLSKDTVRVARECTQSAFNLSANYIERSAFETVKKFYDLYFADQDIINRKNEIQNDVDQMIDALQSQIAEGIQPEKLQIEQKFETERLGLAGIQKQLEGLITLDQGIKEQILPALSSMQFEDAVNQRLDHIVEFWQKFADTSNGSIDQQDFDRLARDLAKICSSVEETKDYYQLVLGEEPPPGQEDRSIFLEF